MNMQQVPHSATAIKINAVALSLFAKEGYYNTSIRKIAAEAGIALGLLYSYYKNKEALLKNMIREGLSQIKDEFIATVSDDTDIKKSILAAYSVLIKFEEHWRLLQIIRTQRSLRDFLQAEIEDIELFFLEHFRKLLKKQGIAKARTESRLIWASLEGLFGQRLLSAAYSDEKALNQLSARYA